jgi:hypothetical protein
MTVTIEIDDTSVPVLEEYRLTQFTARYDVISHQAITTFHYDDVPDMVRKVVDQMVSGIQRQKQEAPIQ